MELEVCQKALQSNSNSKVAGAEEEEEALVLNFTLHKVDLVEWVAWVEWAVANRSASTTRMIFLRTFLEHPILSKLAAEAAVPAPMTKIPLRVLWEAWVVAGVAACLV